MHAGKCITTPKLFNGLLHSIYLMIHTAGTVAETCTPACENGGVCSSGYCDCPSGYWGSYCQNYGGICNRIPNHIHLQ